ncbi:phosphoglycerate mutase-like protein [Dendrothele bispora CBS 962.96]|uniref:Phosphoglycerate mutase-like protein n=1 Tax=Dendrothele bispora (strain CBS 962.96) TaxID=1314807 RepID=A0A4S8KW69_DENBC|nr:phosphoglycerate mutase-like protein [Dendrothele bispora CBS 962.96]
MADVERGQQTYDYDHDDNLEQEALLPSPSKAEPDTVVPPSSAKSSGAFCSRPRFNLLHVSSAFVAGILGCALAQYAICGPNCFSSSNATGGPPSRVIEVYAPPYAGSTEVHPFPPTSPTNAFPSLFPTDVGYPGGTPTGAEAAVIATAPSYPLHTGAAQLVAPASLGDKNSKSNFDLFKKWGNLSPWYSVGRGAFGVDSGPETPETCRITGLHFLHRHGARYPTAWASYGGPADFAGRLNKAAKDWTATGDLEFLNEWTYKLGEEVLTPFGRQQLYDLGISMRLKYGFLLNNFTETNALPVFRTESQDRMLNSAMNFAIGFFGYPFQEQYQQSITIEASGFNNTLAPYETCPNARRMPFRARADWYVERWAEIYLKDANARIQAQISGYNLTIEDTYVMQQMCAYETVALGYSKFCELFTEEEWDGFDYALDLAFWYGSAFGAPTAHAQGAGWIQELIARLEHKPIAEHRFSTNATLNDNPITFPLNQSLYVDATHEVVVLNIITALNLTSFASEGPLPYTHIPEKRPFKVSELAPFATNLQFQILECTSTPGQQIRIIINDGVAPLTGIEGCPEQKDGMCPVDAFVKSQKKLMENLDWEYDCYTEFDIPDGPGWETTTGDSPKGF